MPFNYPTRKQRNRNDKTTSATLTYFSKRNKDFQSFTEIMERLQKRSIYGKRKKDKESTAQARKSEGPLNFLSPLLEGIRRTFINTSL